jgi:aldehyde dehydrogenase (NAD+)
VVSTADDWIPNQDLLVDGQRVAAANGRREPTLDPSTGEVLVDAACGGRADAEAAIAAARRCVDHELATMAPVDRGRLLEAVSDRLLERAESLVQVDVRNAGLPVRMAKLDVEVAARYFEFYAGTPDKLHGRTIPLGDSAIDFTLREPHGVCAVITPFNVPMQMFARSVAPAIAAGNAVVVKPAEQAPLPALALADIFVEVGPPGLVNIVPGDGAEVGGALIAHSDVDHVTFTGSNATGRRVGREAVDAMKPVTLELGGKSPQIVFDDADLEDAAAAIVGSAVLTAGQVCSAGSRVLVERGV